MNHLGIVSWSTPLRHFLWCLAINPHVESLYIVVEKVFPNDSARIMEVLNIKPGREIGWILHALFQEVLDLPERNTPEYLEQRAKELLVLDPVELAKLGEAGKEKKEEKEEGEVAEIRKKYNVK
jgi:hypothetical protein